MSPQVRIRHKGWPFAFCSSTIRTSVALGLKTQLSLSYKVPEVRTAQTSPGSTDSVIGEVNEVTLGVRPIDSKGCGESYRSRVWWRGRSWDGQRITLEGHTVWMDGWHGAMVVYSLPKCTQIYRSASKSQLTGWSHDNVNANMMSQVPRLHQQQQRGVFTAP